MITAAREDKQINYKEFVEHLKSLDDVDEDHIEADLQKASTVSGPEQQTCFKLTNS